MITTLQAMDLSCFRQGHPLFQSIDFTLHAGQGLWIKGPNGIGKSSLLRIIAGMATCNKGSLHWNNQPLETDKSNYLSHLHYLGHADGLRTGLTVQENIQLASMLAQQPLQNLPAVLSDLQLDGIQDKLIQHLSAGQKRRVALARLFLLPRKLWIMDEPLTTLDINSQQIIHDYINRHLQQNGLCILTSHQPLTVNNFKQLELLAC